LKGETLVGEVVLVKSVVAAAAVHS